MHIIWLGDLSAQGRGSASSCGPGGTPASPAHPGPPVGPWRLCLGLCSCRAGQNLASALRLLEQWLSTSSAKLGASLRLVLRSGLLRMSY